MTRAFFAPGRVNLIGEHTDYSGGLVLPAALELGTRIEGTAAGARIVLRSAAFPEPVDVAIGDGPERTRGWGRYVAAVAAELDGRGRPRVGFVGDVTSTVPIGAGLSSSAALSVAVATALCAVAGFELPPLELARAAQAAEIRAIGVGIGIMDQAVSVLGRAEHAILVDTATLDHRPVPLPPGLALVVVDSGTSHAHEDSGYATRRRQLEEALSALGGRAPASLRAAEVEALDLRPVPRRRLRHVVTENERVREVVAVLERRPLDAGRLGELFREGHESLRRDFEVSTPALDRLVELARAHGALAARMTGGGFGGSIVALAVAEDAQRLADAVVTAYGGGRAYVTRAGDGARELRDRRGAVRA